MSWFDTYKQQAEFWRMAAELPGVRPKGCTEQFCIDAQRVYEALAEEAESK